MTAPSSPLATPMPWDLVSGAYVEEVAPLRLDFIANLGVAKRR